MFLETLRRWGDFWNVDWWGLFSGFSLDKTEDVWSVSIVVNKGSTESTSVALDHLLFSTFNEIQLDVSIDSLTSIRSWDTEQCCPFFIVWEDITDNLSFFKFSRSLENFNLFFSFIGDTDVIYWGSGNYCKDSLGDPSPKDNILGEFNVLKFGFLIEIENLENVSFSLIWCFQSDDVVLNVHDGTIDFASWSLDDIHFIE